MLQHVVHENKQTTVPRRQLFRDEAVREFMRHSNPDLLAEPIILKRLDLFWLSTCLSLFGIALLLLAFCPISAVAQIISAQDISSSETDILVALRSRVSIKEGSTFDIRQHSDKLTSATCTVIDATSGLVHAICKTHAAESNYTLRSQLIAGSVLITFDEPLPWKEAINLRLKYVLQR